MIDFKLIRTPRGQKKLTIGHLRKAIEGLSDDVPVTPQFYLEPRKYDPAVKLHGFAVTDDKIYDDYTGKVFILGVSQEPLEGSDDDRT